MRIAIPIYDGVNVLDVMGPANMVRAAFAGGTDRLAT